MITTVDWFLVALISTSMLAFLALIQQFFAGRGRLGPVLWTADPGPNWFVLIWFVLVVLHVTEVVYYLHKNPNRALMSGLMAACFASIGVINSKPIASFRVHEGGISAGFLILPWDRLSGWAFGPNDGWRKPASLTGRDYAGSGRQCLYLWTPSWWRFFYSTIPSRPLKTSVANAPELVALLERYAPDGGRSISATV